MGFFLFLTAFFAVVGKGRRLIENCGNTVGVDCLYDNNMAVNWYPHWREGVSGMGLWDTGEATKERAGYVDVELDGIFGPTCGPNFC